MDSQEKSEEFYVEAIELQSKCKDDGRVCIVYPDGRHIPAGHDILLSWAHLCVRIAFSPLKIRAGLK